MNRAMPRHDEGGDLLTEDEVTTLLVLLVESRGKRGFSERDGVRLVRWATETRVATILLGWLLDGRAAVELPDEGEPLFLMGAV